MKFWLDNKRPHVECTEEELTKAFSNTVEYYKLQCKIAFRVFLLVPNRLNWKIIQSVQRMFKEGQT